MAMTSQPMIMECLWIDKPAAPAVSGELSVQHSNHRALRACWHRHRRAYRPIWLLFLSALSGALRCPTSSACSAAAAFGWGWMRCACMMHVSGATKAAAGCGCRPQATCAADEKMGIINSLGYIYGRQASFTAE